MFVLYPKALIKVRRFSLSGLWFEFKEIYLWCFVVSLFRRFAVLRLTETDSVKGQVFRCSVSRLIFLIIYSISRSERRMCLQVI
jgi:hypothetical protein